MPSSEQLMQVIHIQTEIAKLGLDLGGVMQYIVDETLPLIDADGAAIELAEEGEMVYRAASGIAAHLLGLRLEIDTSLSGLCVRTGKTLSCSDSEIDSRVDRVACRKVGLRSMIVMPLKYKGTTVGVLKAMSKVISKFREPEMALLGMLSEVVAASMYFSAKYGNDDLFFMATHDGMTGLANRALFLDRMRNALAVSGRGGGAMGLLMIDLDGLKQCNDNFGHRVGDAMIRGFATRLKQCIRATDTAARLGGDEFGVVLTPLDPAESLEAVVTRIGLEIEQPFFFEGKQYPLRASIGYVLVPQDGVDAEPLMELADQRMYAVKQARKRGYCLPAGL